MPAAISSGIRLRLAFLGNFEDTDETWPVIRSKGGSSGCGTDRERSKATELAWAGPAGRSPFAVNAGTHPAKLFPHSLPVAAMRLSSEDEIGPYLLTPTE
jgi:hypothetical protein